MSLRTFLNNTIAALSRRAPYDSLPDARFDFTQARQGAVVLPIPRTTRIMIEIDTELLAWIDTHLTVQGGGTVSTYLHEALVQYKTICEEG